MQMKNGLMLIIACSEAGINGYKLYVHRDLERF